MPVTPLKTRPAITATVETVTPTMARSLLGSSNGNRSTKKHKLAAYERDMAAGNWQTNGETIIVDDSGTLLNGHHRLMACIKSGVPFQTVLVRGVAPDSQKTIDMGASRTTADALSFYGVKNANVANSVIRVLMSLQAGRERSANPSSSEAFEFLADNDITAATTFAGNKFMPRCAGLVGAMYYIAERNGETDLAVEFAHVLRSGIPAYPGCAAHALRERVSRDALRGKPVPVNELHKLFFGAWEKFRLRTSVRTLRTPTVFQATGWPE